MTLFRIFNVLYWAMMCETPKCLFWKQYSLKTKTDKTVFVFSLKVEMSQLWMSKNLTLLKTRTSCVRLHSQRHSVVYMAKLQRSEARSYSRTNNTWNKSVILGTLKTVYCLIDTKRRSQKQCWQCVPCDP